MLTTPPQPENGIISVIENAIYASGVVYPLRSSLISSQGNFFWREK